MARAVQQEKNRRKNMKRRLKKQAEQEEAAAAPAELTPLQKLQKLIDELEEYIPSKPTWGVPLDKYIPWEEMERKTRLKSWLHQMLQRAQEGKKLPLPEELSIFYKEDEITIEKLKEMLKDFSCNMVSIPPPASLQSPAVTPPVATYRRRNRGKGKGQNRNGRLNPNGRSHDQLPQGPASGPKTKKEKKKRKEKETKNRDVPADLTIPQKGMFEGKKALNPAELKTRKNASGKNGQPLGVKTRKGAPEKARGGHP
ncbi:hypothetical protein Taro_012369, partial [Colocasia esculenta]|nr:hypothetical protein [Colocasia esculenta]